MRRTIHINDINADEFELRVESVIHELQRRGKMTEDEALSNIIDVLAFKYWQENKSSEVCSSIDSFDGDYVRIHWNQFCNSIIGKSIGCLGLDHHDEDVVAACMGIFTEYVTHRNFDSTNVAVIEKLLERHKHVFSNEKLCAKVNALMEVYRRNKKGGCNP